MSKKVVKITKWDESKGYEIEVLVDVSEYLSQHLVMQFIELYLANPLVSSVEYNGKVRQGSFSNPIKVL